MSVQCRYGFHQRRRNRQNVTKFGEKLAFTKFCISWYFAVFRVSLIHNFAFSRNGAIYEPWGWKVGSLTKWVTCKNALSKHTGHYLFTQPPGPSTHLVKCTIYSRVNHKTYFLREDWLMALRLLTDKNEFESFRPYMARVMSNLETNIYLYTGAHLHHLPFPDVLRYHRYHHW